MPRPSLLPIYDRALGGRLVPLLREWKAEGESLREMAFRLRSEHDIDVDQTTVRRWIQQLEDNNNSCTEGR